MSIGMTYEEYWYASPHLVIAYKKAHKLRQQQLNEQLWLQGMYIHDAFAVVISNCFGKGRKQKYPTEPYEIYKKDDREIRQNAEKERTKAIESLNALKGMMDFKFKGDK